jgi:hypothetical protein
MFTIMLAESGRPRRVSSHLAALRRTKHQALIAALAAALFVLAPGGLGFEPRLAESESGAITLFHLGFFQTAAGNGGYDSVRSTLIAN